MPRALLLDHSVPHGIQAFLTGFEVRNAFQMGWHELGNGDLLAAAEQAGFAVLVTADQNLRYQQSLAGRRIAIVELSTNHWPTLQQGGYRLLAALDGIGEGVYIELAFERPKTRRRPAPGPGPRSG